VSLLSTELEEVPMRIVVALDVHRRQIAYKTLDRESGEVRRGRIVPATRGAVRDWLERFAGCEAEFALEGTTGWRFVVEEIERAGQRAHLADPAETAVKRGRKRRAKTDNADCDLQLRLLLAGELPESWIPPAHILELRIRVRTRKLLIDQRTAWQQRLQAQLLHQGVAAGLKPRTRAGREAIAATELSPAGRELVALSLRTIDTIDRELVALDRSLRAFARRQPACRALIANLYGVGAISATAILAELGDCRRFTSSDDAVRHSGLDVTVYHSDRKRGAGRPFCGAFAEPSDGLEPSTPSLPCAPFRKRLATDGNGFGVIPPFFGAAICHRLPPVATTGLHKGSILCCLHWLRRG
jgi:transposase